jgi:hypothetical protein
VEAKEKATRLKMKNKKPTYCLLMPEKIYLNFSLIEDLLRPEIKGYCSDYLKEVISIIACNIRKNEESTQIQITYLRKLVPQGDNYLKALIDLNIIQRSGNAILGQSSFQYNFAPDYQSKFISLPLNNAKLIRRIEAAQTERRKEAAKSIRGHSEQLKYLKELSIAPEWKAFIEANYKAETDQYNSIVASATRIINNDIFYIVDNTSGRFHSNVTNMAKGLRPFLRINDEPLINLDIKNSQPYLSTILLTDPGKVSYLTKNPAFVLLLQTLKVSLKEDIEKYISLVISGQIYEYLMAEFFKEGLKLTRDETKKQMLRILFARNRMPQDEINRKARQIFKDRFPTVHRIFSKIRGSEKGDRFKNYKRFAILLQRIESYLMLDIILKRIYRELPGTIAITIHDSIMTGVLTNNVEAVRKIMIEELIFFVGFAPKIKIESISEEKEKEEQSLNNMMPKTLQLSFNQCNNSIN